MGHITEERFKELSEKPIEQITPEELIELNSIESSGISGYVQIGNASRAIEFARNEHLPLEQRKALRSTGLTMKESGLKKL